MISQVLESFRTRRSSNRNKCPSSSSSSVQNFSHKLSSTARTKLRNQLVQTLMKSTNPRSSSSSHNQFKLSNQNPSNRFNSTSNLQISPIISVSN
ncbi:hypothetical protein A4A49_36798 [Nicotiana attenuata]|uniref:Uncharacterized protein n=1 Tax=Nicotiana attenuata TaxID=49451 RepID=A0A1J6KVE3_NICAT|nr:hypothetical protein A4A49_36798 [Nicotiana attenuata]